MTRSALCLLVVLMPFATASAEDAIKKELDKARATYDEQIETAKQNFLSAAQTLLDEYADTGDYEAVKEIEAQKAAFERAGSRPTSSKLATAKSDYETEVHEAAVSLKKALKRARTEYTKARRFKEADAINIELKSIAGEVKTSANWSEASADLLQKGTVWKGFRRFPNGDRFPFELHIASRDGSRFKGHTVSQGKIVVEVEGSVTDDNVEWKTTNARNVKARGPKSRALLPHTGTITGNKLTMEFEAHLGKGTGQLTLETYADEPSRGSLGATAPASDETSPGEKMPDAADFDSNLKRYDAAWNRAKKQLVQRIKNRLEDIKTSDLDGDEKQRRLAAIERDLLAFQNTGALPNSDDVLDVVIGVLESHQVPIANLESMRAYWSDKAVRLNDKDAITKLAALEQRLDKIVGGREQFVAGSKWAGTRQAGNVALQMHLTVRERTGTSFTGSLSQTGKFGRGDVMNIDGQLDRNMINFRTAAMIRGAERKLEFRGYLLSDRIITNVSGIAWNGNRVNNWMSLWREGAGPGQRGRRGTVSGQ